jgi:hypothetical protein
VTIGVPAAVGYALAVLVALAAVGLALAAVVTSSGRVAWTSVAVAGISLTLTAAAKVAERRAP